MKILIVEDNALLGKSMKQALEETGWTIDLARDGLEGLQLAESEDYHLLLVDRMLPNLSGTDLIAKLRRMRRQVPVMMVTAKGAVPDRVSGLELGADDYLVKPFEMTELIARVKALYRRSLGSGDSMLRFEHLVIDVDGRSVSCGGHKVDLTAKEFDLLAALAARPGRVFRRTEISSLLYEFEGAPESNSLDVLLARLRRKLTGSGVEIATVRGRGFVFRVEAPTT